MFSKKKKKIEISAPSNFQHRVHTGFDNHSNKFVGLPKQWASLVDDKPGGESPLRPSPMVDPSSYTDVLDDPGGGPPPGHPGKNPYTNNHHQRLMQNSVVRSNSLRSNSPPQFRRRGPPPAPHLPPVPETDDSRFQHAQHQYHPAQGRLFKGIDNKTGKAKLLQEPVCCKKQNKKFLTSYWFVE